jgi:hypothetical protein
MHERRLLYRSTVDRKSISPLLKRARDTRSSALDKIKIEMRIIKALPRLDSMSCSSTNERLPLMSIPSICSRNEAWSALLKYSPMHWPSSAIISSVLGSISSESKTMSGS